MSFSASKLGGRAASIAEPSRLGPARTGSNTANNNSLISAGSGLASSERSTSSRIPVAGAPERSAGSRLATSLPTEPAEQGTGLPDDPVHRTEAERKAQEERGKAAASTPALDSAAPAPALDWLGYSIKVLQAFALYLSLVPLIIAIALREVFYWESIVFGLALSGSLIAVNAGLRLSNLKKEPPYILDVASLVYFVIHLALWESKAEWRDSLASLLCITLQGWMSGIMFFSIAARYPWALQHAKEAAPQVAWSAPSLRSVVDHIAGVWAGVEALCSVLSVIPYVLGSKKMDPLNIVFNYVLPYLMLVALLALTRWWPSFMRVKYYLPRMHQGTIQPGEGQAAGTAAAPPGVGEPQAAQATDPSQLLQGGTPGTPPQYPGGPLPQYPGGPPPQYPGGPPPQYPGGPPPPYPGGPPPQYPGAPPLQYPGGPPPQYPGAPPPQYPGGSPSQYPGAPPPQYPGAPPPAPQFPGGAPPQYSGAPPPQYPGAPPPQYPGGPPSQYPGAPPAPQYPEPAPPTYPIPGPTPPSPRPAAVTSPFQGPTHHR